MTNKAMDEALATQSWDLVIADYSLPRFSGLAALKLLQEKGIDLPFIVVSGTIGEDIAVAAMKAGAHVPGSAVWFDEHCLRRQAPPAHSKARVSASPSRKGIWS